jgi:hypothetical protein
MAGTSRFHDKLHRANHHSVTTPGLPDSAYDPIASSDYPFRGDFVLSGALSALNSVTTRQNLTVNEISQLQGPIYTNNTGSVVTTISYPVTANNGPATLTFNYSKGVYINGTYGSTPKLIIGIPGIDYGVVNVTNVDATSARLTTLTVSSAVGIGTAHPQHPLHVVGDVIIYGSLTANGNSYFQNTLFSTTSSLSIINTGTGAGLTVSQEGNQPIVAFYDHESSISLWADGDASRPGWVGVKTRTPNVEFTVAGNISASNIIYSANSNSNQWYSGYSTVLASSASWGGGGSSSTVVVANSAKWNANYTTTSTNSSKWDSNYTTTSTNSSKWDSSYSTVLAGSAAWGSSVVATNSAKWESNYTTTSTNSARWVANYTTTNTKSASWDSSYTTVQASSASWNAGGGSGGAVYSTVNALSTNWNNSYNALTAASGNWNSSYVTLLANSGAWDSAAGALVDIDLDYLADVSITSNTLADGQVLTYDIGTQQWENSSLVLSGVIQGSSLWASSYSTTNAASANWNTGYSTVTANSARWNSVYSTTSANSANWNTGYTAYTTITANSATWNTNSLSGSTDVVITSPVNNALLQYSTAQGKWIDGDTLATTGVLTAGSLKLTTAEVSTFTTDLSANGDFLLININGTTRKLRLWD